MFTLYSMAAQGEGNVGALTSDTYMKPYFGTARSSCFNDREPSTGQPSCNSSQVSRGFAQQKAPGGYSSKLQVHVASLAADCASQPGAMPGGKPLFGVPSTRLPGGTSGKCGDNRVHYIFDHAVDKFVATGGLGAVFGTGAGNQTYITSDGDRSSKTAVAKYFASPTLLP